MLNQQAKTQSATAKKTGLSFLLILSALMAVTSLSTDIYLPAMPVMAKDLQGDAELTITGFLIGFCIAQLIWGPISDRYGRRLPLFIGLGLFIGGLRVINRYCTNCLLASFSGVRCLYRADAGSSNDP